ncbi:MFS transporter [Alkaliphilus sp. MSJ-5]|uniref:MFS transporter n=1 Tax=Alkaliphilus flagellatus TaxID=2841507 RepID=A0ABS6G4K3_9FIRM|nr:MFS transporter [Alkaliphilus flagellatus]MBU5677104.1 MFS transporter [Alkaliphilus flagellatus]
MKKYQTNILIGITFFSMILLGILESIRGVLIPSIQNFYHIDYKEIGIFLFVASLGYVIANFFGGNTADSLGQKRLLLLGVLLITLGTLGMVVSRSYIFFIVSVAILNYGFGSISIGANTLTPVVFKNNQGMMMNLLHFFYGLGATIGPRYAGVALDYKWSWQEIYSATLIIIVIYTIFVLTSTFPRIEGVRSEARVPLMEVLRNKKVLLFSFVLGFYVAAELGVANWLTTYLQSSKNIGSLKSATYLSLFFGVFTFGRLIGGFIVEKLGYFRSIIGFLIIALLLFIIGTTASKQLVILISLSGFFFSIIYPTTFALLLKEFDKGTSTVIGVVITISSATNMIGNAVIGQINDMFGVNAGFRLVALFLLITVALILILKKDTTFENQI